MLYYILCCNNIIIIVYGFFYYVFDTLDFQGRRRWDLEQWLFCQILRRFRYQFYKEKAHILRKFAIAFTVHFRAIFCFAKWLPDGADATEFFQVLCSLWDFASSLIILWSLTNKLFLPNSFKICHLFYAEKTLYLTKFWKCLDNAFLGILKV